VRVQWQGVEAEDVYPRKPADIFYGGELVLMGRFKSGGKGSVVVTGQANGRPARFVYPVELPNEESKNAFLPRLWANLKVAHELDAVRLNGSPSQEVIDSIVRLAKRYGIVTPYTSFLITEETPVQHMPQPAAMDFMRERMMAQAARLHSDASESGRGGGALAMSAQRASSYFAQAKGMISGAAQTAGSASSFELAMASAEQETRLELKTAGVRATQTRSAGGKTFYLRGGVWVDGEIENSPAASRKTVSVRTMSEEYFKLIASVPGLAKYLSLGRAVKVCLGGVVYETVE
jgi:Ca-activated chloride channel family protein